MQPQDEYSECINSRDFKYQNSYTEHATSKIIENFPRPSPIFLVNFCRLNPCLPPLSSSAPAQSSLPISSADLVRQSHRSSPGSARTRTRVWSCTWSPSFGLDRGQR